MTLTFHYRRIRSSRAAYCRGGTFDRLRPSIDVTLVGPASTTVRLAMIDSGADDTVFPESVAAIIGIDLTQAPTGQAAGIGGQPLLVRFAHLELRITDGTEFRAWPACVGFVGGGSRSALLGHAGFLQYFTTTFYGDREEVELTVNSTYPGT